MLAIFLFIFAMMVVANYLLPPFIMREEAFDCKNSFCAENYKNTNCQCKFQKDTVRFLFDNAEKCCLQRCASRSASEGGKCGLPEEDDERIPYYCPEKGECVKKTGTTNYMKVGGNFCSFDPLNNQPVGPFASYEECKKTIMPCDRFNNERGICDNSMKQSCLNDVNCGLCSNSENEFKCIPATKEGPLDIMRYPNCIQDPKNDEKNRFIYGDHADGFLQPATIPS